MIFLLISSFDGGTIHTIFTRTQIGTLHPRQEALTIFLSAASLFAIAAFF